MMKISEAYGKVIIDGFEFYGQVDENKVCSQCNSHLVYYDKFDTYFCPKCNTWTESKCSDPYCNYCPNTRISYAALLTDWRGIPSDLYAKCSQYDIGNGGGRENVSIVSDGN